MLIAIGVLISLIVVAFSLRSRFNPAPLGVDRQLTSGPGVVAVAYLTKIAAGDAAAAQALAAEQTSGPLLSPSELQARNAAAPISNIRVHNEQTTSIVLAYQRGDQHVTGVFPVVQRDGRWLVRRASASVRVAPQPQMVPLLVDDTAVQSPSYTFTVELFPGVHTLATTSPWLVFAAPELSVDGLEPPDTDGSIRTTAGYPAALRQQLDTRLRRCLNEKQLAPPGCPWAARQHPEEPVIPASIRWTLLADPWRGFTAPQLGRTDAIVHGRLDFRVRLDATIMVGGNAQPLRQDFQVATGYAADLLTPEPAFVWED